MKAQWKNNIMTLTNGNKPPQSYFKDGNSWRHISTFSLVSPEDHRLLNHILQMGRNKIKK